MKFSLFVEGGAYNTIFSYGAICALIKILNDNELNIFNSIVANSSSLGFMTYFFSKELNTKGKKVMLELCDDKNILDSKKINRLFYGKKPYFDIGYLVHTLSTKKQIIPNYDEIKKNIERLLIPILNVQTLQTEYISFNNDNFNESTYKLYLEAAMAMPILYDKYVEVNKKKYVDGALKDVFQIEHKKLKNSKKLMILSSRENDRYSLVFDILIVILSKFGRLDKKIYDLCIHRKRAIKEKYKKLNVLQNNGEILIIEPSINFSKQSKNRKEMLETGFQDGYNQVMKKKDEIKEFLKLY